MAFGDDHQHGDPGGGYPALRAPYESLSVAQELQRARVRRRIRLSLIAAAVAVCLVGAVGAIVYRLAGTGDGESSSPLDANGCGAITVAAAPEVAPLLEVAAQELGAQEANCVELTVTAQDPVEVAASEDFGGADLWVPTSSVWLRTVDAELAGVGTSIARSPLVLAMPQQLAESLGWPDTPLGWNALNEHVTSGAIPQFHMPEPRTPIGLLAAASLHAALAGTTPDAGIAQMRFLTLRSRLAAFTDTTELLGRMVDYSDPAMAIAEVGVFPALERQLWEYAGADPAVPLTAVYPSDVLLEADYPLVPVHSGRGNEDLIRVATQLADIFTTPEMAEVLAEHGYRPPRRAAAAAQEIGVPEGVSAEYPAPTRLSNLEVTTTAVEAWRNYQRLSFNVLVLVDASSSMNDPVRDQQGRLTTKAGLLREAGVQAAQLFGLETNLGLWMFSTQSADTPYTEVVPFGPISEDVGGGVTRRELVASAAAQYQPVPDSGTPLYETVLRAVEVMTERVAPQSFTLVVVLTDGRDEDSQWEMSLSRFQERLAAVADPTRPVPVFSIGYGTDADMAALEQIAQLTGGQAVPSTDPADLASAMAQVFLAAHQHD